MAGVDLRRDDTGSKFFNVFLMLRELTFSQRQHSRQVPWLLRYAIEALTRHTHELEPVILYLFPQAVIILDSIPFEEERYGGDLIEW